MRCSQFCFNHVLPITILVISTTCVSLDIGRSPTILAASIQDHQGDDHLRVVPADPVTHSRTGQFNGKSISYEVTAGTLPVVDEQGKTLAELFYVYYRQLDIPDSERRPLTFSFNGGPGSSSVWMHLGYTSPRKLKIDPEGFPIQPFGVVDNPDSILDVTDLVYVDPVNTGFSRPTAGVDPAQFFGVQNDITYLAAWIERFVSIHGRWRSPLFLKGESYGTTRVAGLSQRLQQAHRLFVDGVMLVSPTEMGLERADIVKAALLLPHYTATAWYHQQLVPELQQQDLEQILAEVEQFALEQYLPALARGNSLPVERQQEMASAVARFAGVTPTFVQNHNLMVPISAWRKELLREQRLTVGRLDARYRGIDRDAAGTVYDYDPAMSAWNQAFTPAINHYLREELQFNPSIPYNIFGSVSPWDRSGDRTAESLRRSMAENPWLKVLVQSGYYDGGTDYFSAKYTLWNMDRSGQLADRMFFKTYRSGHMMYLRAEDMPTSNQHLREFILDAIPTENDPARYQLNR